MEQNGPVVLGSCNDNDFSQLAVHSVHRAGTGPQGCADECADECADRNRVTLQLILAAPRALLLSGMNQAHLHLIVNHLPIMGSLFGAILLATGTLKANATLTRAGLVAVLAAGVLCLPAQFTGEGAAAVAQQLPRASRALIHNHEEAAELGFWAVEGAATLALFALLLLKSASPKARLATLLALLATLLSFGLLARAGNLGGQIAHPEIREGFGTTDEL